MNKDRRSALAKIRGQLDDLRAQIEELRDQEQEYFDNMPEAFQEGERGSRATEAVDCMERATDGLNDVMESLEGAEGE